MNNHVLTEDQQEGLQTFKDFVNDPVAKIMTLTGGPGTGKSFLLQHCVKAYPKPMDIAFCTTTNKAAKVLRRMASDQGIRVGEISTIYKLLGLVLKPDGDVKQISQGAMSRTSEYKIICIDEASMANDSILDFIKEDLSYSSAKVIFIGDINQLNPVNHEKSNAFDLGEYQINLTKIVRQVEGNPIISLLSDIRRSIEEGKTLYKFKNMKDGNGHGVYVLPKSKWLHWMKSGFSSQAYESDGDAFRAIAWTNRRVGFMNRQIRQSIYGEQSQEKFIVGEKVLNAAPIQDRFQDEILAPTDSEGVIKEINICMNPTAKMMKLGDFKCYHMKVSFQEIGLVDCYSIHEDGLQDYNKKLNTLGKEAKKDRKLWSTFWAFKDSFHDIRPGHACTAHRSQGSSYGTVFVDAGDILENKNFVESLRCLYVACSRSVNNLIILE